MDPVAKTPTEPVDYAALSAGYGALLGALLLAAQRRESLEGISASELAPLGLACFALSKLVTKEKAHTWMREPFVEEHPSGERRPRGRRLRYAVGELLTCSRCAGAWSALGLVAFRLGRPREARVLNTVLGVSAANDFLQSAFTLLCARSNVSQSEAGAPAPEAGAHATAPQAAAATPVATRLHSARPSG